MKKNKKGLPLEIKYCSKCNISNQQPTSINEYFHNDNTVQTTIEFDSNNVCSACNFNALKWNDKIDWNLREKELIELCDKYRSKDGSYDCIVGGSGGKDSVFQSHMLKYKYNMKPLTVTWAPHIYTEIGFIACKVDDFYIHEVVKIFKNNGYPKIQAMPGYFPQDMIPDEVKIGAHISLQYRKSTTAKHIEDLKRVTGINLHKWVCFSS